MPADAGVARSRPAAKLAIAFGHPWVRVAALTLLALIVRASQLHQSFYGDEMYTYSDVVGHGLGTTIRTVNTGVENNPPLYFILAWLVAKLGHPLVMLRAPSLVFGVGTVPLTYWLGRETVGERAGWVGAAVVAASPFTTFYAVEARPYATMMFFVTLASVACVRAAKGGSWRWWALYAVAEAGAAYSHYTSVFALAALGAWALYACRDRLRGPLLATAGAAVLFAPWVSHLNGKGLSVFSLIEPLSIGNVVEDVIRAAAGYPYAAVSAIPAAIGLIVLGLSVGFAFAFGVGHLGRATVRRREVVLICALAVATPVGLLLYSLLVTDLWTARCLSASIPPTALVVGALMVRLPRPVGGVMVAAVLVVLVLGTVRSLGSTYARPPFKAAAAELDRVAPPGDPILMYPSLSNLSASIRVQFGEPHRVVNDARARWPGGLAHGGRVFVVVDDTVARILHIAWPRPAGFALVGAHRYRGLLPFTVLTYRGLRRASR